ncbi:MAG TPA: tetratricopeptide repeat protein [Phototrophicaceae bacterium]|jgi:tetratricopeptide (TPR) repeat protein|nr:tetratricopeptide repeat protein [Phototrophicaceae bacterium]
MRDNLNAIETLLKQREVKKADILIARQLRSSSSDRDQAQLMVLRARTRLLSARPEAAVDDLIRVRAMDPDLTNTAENLELLADCHFARFELSTVGFADRNDARQAEQIYCQILERFPGYENLGWVYYQLGRILLTDNRIDAALDYIQQALLTPSHVSALTAYCYERLGFVAFYEQRDLSRSMTFLSKAIDTYPASEDRLWLVQVHILRSRVLREMYHMDQALQEAEKALNLATAGRTDRRSALAEALLTTGELLTTIEGREREVITHLEQFLQVSRRPPGIDVTWSRVYEMLGDAYFRQGRYDDAVMAYNAVMQFNPYHPWEDSVYHRVARVYYQQGNYEKAVNAIQHALDVARSDGHDPDYRLYDVFGSACFALGKYDRAAEAYAAALKLAPAHHDSLDKIRKYHRVSLEKLNQTL